MLVFLHPRVSSRVSGFPVASPSLWGKLRTPHSTLYTPHSTIYTLDSKVYNLHSTLYTFHFTLLTPHLRLYTPHSTLYTTLYTFHSFGKKRKDSLCCHQLDGRFRQVSTGESRCGGTTNPSKSLKSVSHWHQKSSQKLIRME